MLVFLTSLLYRHGDEESGWQRSREAVDDAAEALLNLSVGTVSDSFEADPSALLRFSISSHNHATSVLKSIGLSFPEDVPNFAESTIGGQTTCIICFINPKSHAAVPCGHQCACSDCSAQMRDCLVCRNPAREQSGCRFEWRDLVLAHEMTLSLTSVAASRVAHTRSQCARATTIYKVWLLALTCTKIHGYILQCYQWDICVYTV